MGYFTINKYHIFYSDERFLEVNRPFYEKLSATEMISMKILGLDGKPDINATKLANLQTAKLTGDFKVLSLTQFIDKWVEFDFKDEEARNCSWEVIYDYFHITKRGQIEDVRDFGTQLVNNYNGQNISFPQGQIIKFSFTLAETKNTFSKLFHSKKVLTKIVDLSKIQRISGSLINLEITTDHEILRLNDNIEILDKGLV